jgi:pimeloyl-ACP methyl ester carboxylesterase
VVLGGFLSTPRLYRGLARTLADDTGALVAVVDIGVASWLGAVSARGWSRILRELDRAVRRAAAASPTGRVTVVGHSAGGVVSRLYLSPEPFRGESFGGLDRVSRLVSLGSPHAGIAASPMRRFVHERYPGAFFAPRVTYVSVAGQAVLGNRGGSAAERFAARVYTRLGGDAGAWGDGLVPVSCALLEGAAHVVLEGVGHAPPWPGPWYGTPRVVREWWAAVAAPARGAC